MKTAQVTAWGSAPQYVDIDAPEIPSKDSGLVQVKLIAAGQHHLVKSRAAGKHYTSTTLPHIPGVDGVGTLPSGEIVWINTMQTGGSMSELINVAKSAISPLPAGLDPIKAAAFFNPAMSSWMALRSRTTNLPPNFTCVILGATSASGTVAISVARAFGAGKVIGIARNMSTLSTLNLDQKIQLLDPVSSTDFSSLGDVDVVLDYIYGPPMIHLLSSLNSSVPTQYVHIGGLAAQEVSLPGAVLRSKDITIRGSGPGSWKMKDLKEDIPAILNVLKDVRDAKIKIVKLADVEKAWNEGGERMVFVP